MSAETIKDLKHSRIHSEAGVHNSCKAELELLAGRQTYILEHAVSGFLETARHQLLLYAYRKPDSPHHEGH